MTAAKATSLPVTHIDSQSETDFSNPSMHSLSLLIIPTVDTPDKSQSPCVIDHNTNAIKEKEKPSTIIIHDFTDSYYDVNNNDDNNSSPSPNTNILQSPVMNINNRRRKRKLNSNRRKRYRQNISNNNNSSITPRIKRRRIHFNSRKKYISNYKNLNSVQNEFQNIFHSSHIMHSLNIANESNTETKEPKKSSNISKTTEIELESEEIRCLDNFEKYSVEGIGGKLLRKAGWDGKYTSLYATDGPLQYIWSNNYNPANIYLQNMQQMEKQTNISEITDKNKSTFVEIRERNRKAMQLPSTYFSPITHQKRNMAMNMNVEIQKIRKKQNIISRLDRNMKIVMKLNKTQTIDKCKERIIKSFISGDVCVPHETISLMDSYSLCNIFVPARGKYCLHNQPFDLRTFLKKSGKYRKCSICNKSISRKDLIIDKYFQNIFEEVSLTFDEDINEICILNDGSWKPMFKSKILYDGKEIENILEKEFNFNSLMVEEKCQESKINSDENENKVNGNEKKTDDECVSVDVNCKARELFISLVSDTESDLSNLENMETENSNVNLPSTKQNIGALIDEILNEKRKSLSPVTTIDLVSSSECEEDG